MKPPVLWICDVQEHLLPKVVKAEEVLDTICFVIEAFKVFNIPVVVTEQYPQGLGSTVSRIKELLPKRQKYFPKMTFSGASVVGKIPEIVFLMGLEAHICVYQTANDLIEAGKEVVVIADAVSSRRDFDCSTALADLRANDAHIVTAETVIYQLLHDATRSAFSEILPLIKKRG